MDGPDLKSHPKQTRVTLPISPDCLLTGEWLSCWGDANMVVGESAGEVPEGFLDDLTMGDTSPTSTRRCYGTLRPSSPLLWLSRGDLCCPRDSLASVLGHPPQPQQPKQLCQTFQFNGVDKANDIRLRFSSSWRKCLDSTPFCVPVCPRK